MYALIDCNNFYVSCERVFQPWMRHRPVVVLSNNDGCAISRSEEAKRLGIVMGTPAFMLQEMVNKYNVIICSSNYPLYDDMSERVMITLEKMFPRIERYSIDEAFADMHNMPYANLLELGMEARYTIMRNTGIPVCVGIASTKTLAKMANRFAKKMQRDVGVYYAANEELRMRMLEYTEVGDVWGIGPRYAFMLNKNGFKTAADLLKAPEDFIRDKMSVVGLRTINELKGIPCMKWEFTPKIKKNICTSRSFGNLTGKKDDVAQAVANFAASCAEKMRREHTNAAGLNVFIQTNPHRTQDAQYFHSINVKIARPSNDTPTIIQSALKGLNVIWRPGYSYMKAGVIVQDLKPESQVQLALFETTDKVKLNTAMGALDGINHYYGKDTLRIAAQGFDKRYQMRSAFRSPRFTTNIDEILKIKM